MILPFVAIVITAVIMPAIILPAFGAEWFSNCHKDPNVPCIFDYTRYNLFNSLFASISGVITFVFSGFIGSLSDKYGRKPLLYCCILLAIINNAVMIIYVNLYLYWSLQAINSIFAIPTIMTAYISDIIPKQSLKTIGYGMLFAFGSIFFFIGSILGAIIGGIGSDSHYIWITVSALYISLMIYTIFCVKESHHQQPQNIANTPRTRANDSYFNFDHINPIKPLFYVNSNPIILWISVVNLIMAIPGSFFGVLLVYISEQLDINNKNESDLLNMTVFVSMAIGSIVTAAFILPCIKRFEFATDLNIVIIGVTFVMIGNLIFSVIPYLTWIDTELFGISMDNQQDMYLTYFIVVVTGSICFSFFTFTGSAGNSILTKYINQNEHGLAFGIAQSCGGITAIFAPFLFGWGYNESKQIGFPSLMLYIICILLCGLLIILIFPLRNAIIKLEKSKQIFSFKQSKIVDSDQVSILNVDDKNVNTYSTFDDDRI